MDVFTHGFFYEEIDSRQIAAEDLQGSISLENNVYEWFFLHKRHI